MPPLSPPQITQLYNDALRHQAAGDLDGAEARLKQVLAARPRQAEALFQLGRIAMARGAAKKAVLHFDKAAQARPAEPAIWQAYAQAVAALGDRTRARAFMKKAKAARLAPALLAALQQAVTDPARRAPALGSARPDEVQALIALVNSGDLAQADARAAQLRARHPDVAILADIHANVQARLGQAEAARRSHQEAVRLDPGFAEGRANHGRFLVDHGEVAAGVAELRVALEQAPALGPALIGLGIGLTRLGQTDEAAQVLARATRALPKSPEPHLRLGQAMMRAKDFGAAIDAFQAAIALGDRRAETHEALAQALDSAGRPQDALAAHDAALAAGPDRAEGHGRRAILLQTLGRFDEAEAGFHRAIALDPMGGEAYRMLVKGRKLPADDPLIAQMQALFAHPDVSLHSRMNLAFALAKAMEDIGRHDQVFPYLHEANALMRQLYPYDIAERRATVDALKAAFDGVDFAARTVPGTTGYAPIFVTGMPRSGTTLVEQIIASHSRVSGGGELGYLFPEAMAMLSDGAGGLRALDQVPDDQIAALGRRAEAHLRMRVPGADIVTDKSIQTYMVAGVVRLALPNARIVVVHRDPRDTGLSIYKNIFAEGTHRYAYNLRDLGLYTRMFQEMIAFWRDRLPDGFHEIHYEDLIADPEGQARALIAACGLDWEDQCLDFHKTERRVSTLSLHQVRQPIYASSMKAWERHSDDLAELIEALGDAID